VHFLRFELAHDTIEALRRSAGLTIGVDHPRYQASVQIGPETRRSLAEDLA